MDRTEITPFRPEDKPRWAALWRAYLAFYRTTFPAEQFDDTWARLLHGTQIHGLAARRDGAIIGITHYLFHPTAWASAPACYLQDLYVDEAARGAGCRAVADRSGGGAGARARGRPALLAHPGDQRDGPPPLRHRGALRRVHTV